ncbi:MAG: hypothetical protein U0003_00025 [Vampirovibrionales bacterium]
MLTHSRVTRMRPWGLNVPAAVPAMSRVGFAAQADRFVSAPRFASKQPTTLFEGFDVSRPNVETPYVFGTAGYRPGRAITADEVKTIAHAVADYALSQNGVLASKANRELQVNSPTVVIGRDTRESSREYLPLLSAVLRSRGVSVLEAEGPLSTPLASYLTANSTAYHPHKKQAVLAVILTASHNPYQEGGIKVLGPSGSNAQPAVTQQLQLNQLGPARLGFNSDLTPQAQTWTVNPNKAYIQGLKDLFKPKEFKGLGPIPLDIHYGAGAPMAHVLKAFGIKHTVLREGNPPEGYNNNSEPKPENLVELGQQVVATKAPIGIALDGDADRFAAVDETGKLIETTDCLLLALDYLMGQKGWSGLMGRSQSTSRVMDDLYQASGGTDAVYETPVGFKWYEKLFAQAQKNVVMVMESSGGATSGYHSVPEKDGLFMDLVLLAAANQAKQQGLTVSQKIQAIRSSLPTRYSFIETGLDLRSASDGAKDRVEVTMKHLFDSGGHIGQFAIDRDASWLNAMDLQARNGNDKPDGYKFYLNDGKHWVLVRPSGTEAKFRIYVDASSQQTEQDAQKYRDAILEAITLEIDKAANPQNY